MGGETVEAFLLRLNSLAKDCGFEAVNASEHRNQSVLGKFFLQFRVVRMIAITKKDGDIRPIGIGEVIKRLVTKALSWEMKNKIKEASGSIH